MIGGPLENSALALAPKGTQSRPLEQLEKLRNYLERHYKTRISELGRLDRGVYRANRPGQPSWIVRIFPESRSPDRARGDAEILRFLEEKEFPAERNADLDPVTTPAGRSVLVTEFVEGAQPEKTERALNKFGEMIAILSKMPPESGATAREAGALHHYANSEGKLGNEIHAASSWLEEIEDKTSNESRSLLNLLREILETADDLDDLPKALIHPDAIVKNIIEKPNGEYVLIDWTGAGRGPRIFPIAFLIWSGALGAGRWSPGNVDAAVKGYSNLVKLQKDELDRLPGAMMIRQLVFAAWRFRFDVVSGKQPKGNEWWWPSETLTRAISARARSGFDKSSGKKL